MINSKILCLGDSITFGYEIEVSQRWTNLLQENLNCNVLNFGINGDTTSGMLARCERLLIEHHPTHLIILGGTNDLWFGLTDGFIISNIYAIIKQAKHNNVEVIIGIPTPSYNLEELNFQNKNYSDTINNFRKSLINFCVYKDLNYIDFGANMKDYHFLDDGIHPNEAGQIVMNENALGILKKTK
ncbi:GDSL-type esterase/lipase family protein [Yeosuana sp.]|uniref:GDSL-type esterase/lipase family protein n=1 Tax=Yeosuana sp. TaxID=2529388 RepID=UPI004054EC1B